jgi:hypothetical protein
VSYWPNVSSLTWIPAATSTSCSFDRRAGRRRHGDGRRRGRVRAAGPRSRSGGPQCGLSTGQGDSDAFAGLAQLEQGLARFRVTWHAPPVTASTSSAPVGHAWSPGRSAAAVGIGSSVVLVVAAAVGLAVPSAAQAGPALLVLAALLGLPHGAVDHLALGWSEGHTRSRPAGPAGRLRRWRRPRRRGGAHGPGPGRAGPARAVGGPLRRGRGRLRRAARRSGAAAAGSGGRDGGGGTAAAAAPRPGAGGRDRPRPGAARRAGAGAVAGARPDRRPGRRRTRRRVCAPAPWSRPPSSCSSSGPPSSHPPCSSSRPGSGPGTPPATWCGCSTCSPTAGRGSGRGGWRSAPSRRPRPPWRGSVRSPRRGTACRPPSWSSCSRSPCRTRPSWRACVVALRSRRTAAPVRLERRTT